MGCGDECPHIPGKRYLGWDPPDPKGPPGRRGPRTRDDAAVRLWSVGIRSALAILTVASLPPLDSRSTATHVAIVSP